MLKKAYQNYVSLGSRCFITLDLRRMGVHSATNPFDWVFSANFERIVSLINEPDSYKKILAYENMVQECSHKYRYLDSYTGIWYVHDFDDLIPLRLQLRHVRRQYFRRFRRFYKLIKTPTLFIRQIENQSEADYIRTYAHHISQVIKSHNASSDIVFLASPNICIPEEMCYRVPWPKEGVNVMNRCPLSSCPDLKNLIWCPPNRRAKDRAPPWKRFAKMLWRIYCGFLHRLYKKEYVHKCVFEGENNI